MYFFLASMIQRLKGTPVIVKHRPDSAHGPMIINMFYVFSRTTWWIFIKLSGEDVLIVP